MESRAFRKVCPICDESLDGEGEFIHRDCLYWLDSETLLVCIELLLERIEKLEENHEG